MSAADRLSPALSSLRPSAIRELTDLARRTPGCISLALGEPGFDTPRSIRDAAAAALDAGETHYIANRGTDELRGAIADHESRRLGRQVSVDEVIVTIGAQEALFVSLFGVLEPGAELIVPTPAFVVYEQIASLAGARAVPLDTSRTSFQIDEGALNAAIGPRTKAIVLNSPNNPTGAVLDSASLAAVRRAADQHGLFVICDDVYSSLTYSGDCRSFASLDGAHERTLVAQSFSKPYAMTGWRVGWLLAHESIAPRLALLHQFMVTSAPAPFQRACVEALRTDGRAFAAAYERRRDETVARLREMGLEVVMPEGAFYAFPNTESTGIPSAELCRRLIAEAGVALVPGEAFRCPGHVRVSFCAEDDALREGLARMANFLRRAAAHIF